MIGTVMIEKKIGKITEELEYLSPYLKYTFDEIAKDYKTHSFIERIIERIVGLAIDINQHILVEEGKGDLSFGFAKSFILLVELGVYDHDFAEIISQSVGLRNILAHEYTKLDEKIFYASIKDCYRDYTKYCRYIISYLEKKS